MTLCGPRGNGDWWTLCTPSSPGLGAMGWELWGCSELRGFLPCPAAVLTTPPAPGTRPWPSFFGTSRSDTTAASAVERRWRISSCWCGGEEVGTRVIYLELTGVSVAAKNQWAGSRAPCGGIREFPSLGPPHEGER